MLYILLHRAVYLLSPLKPILLASFQNLQCLKSTGPWLWIFNKADFHQCISIIFTVTFPIAHPGGFYEYHSQHKQRNKSSNTFSWHFNNQIIYKPSTLGSETVYLWDYVGQEGGKGCIELLSIQKKGRCYNLAHSCDVLRDPWASLCLFPCWWNLRTVQRVVKTCLSKDTGFPSPCEQIIHLVQAWWPYPLPRIALAKGTIWFWPIYCEKPAWLFLLLLWRSHRKALLPLTPRTHCQACDALHCGSRALVHGGVSCWGLIGTCRGTLCHQ